jgi:crotonobetainyl-CoA:carnitine CoA-transferase CaiB-like acyl-CoA transferase
VTPSKEGIAPLEGLRVVDLSPDRVGAQVSQTLADYGAEVIWIEAPGGSRLRQQRSFPFLARGKRSVVADLATAEGVLRVRSLAASADVLIETFRPGVADRMGLGYEALSAANPTLVYTSITGFGRQGPWAHLKGYEGVVASVLGLYAAFGGLGDRTHPPFVTVPWCSIAASQTALQGILSALLEREASGHGQWVETNLAQALTIHEGASSSWYGYLVSHRWPDAYVATPPVNATGTPMHHFVFRLLVGQTKDGRWLQFAQNRPHLFEAFLRALGLDWMLTDPKWKGIPVLEDEQLRVELLQRMLAGVRERTLGEWQEVFEEDRDVFAELYRYGPEVLEHPQLVHDGSTVEIDDPERGPVRQPGPQFVMRATPAELKGPAPLLDDGAGASWTARTAGASWSSPGADTLEPPSGHAPLEGVTILELAVQYAAPYGVTLLADLGARVIKVEQLEGDSIRRQQLSFPEVGGGKVLQGKESVAVDIRTPEGLQIVHQLAERVDAVVDGFRAGAAERGGFDAETLRRINPDLLYVSAAGYGIGAPCGDRAAFAPSFGAAGGIAAAHLGGPGPEDPTISLEEVAARSIVLRGASASKYASADGIGALGVATVSLLGLLARARGAGGQHLVSSMLLSTAHAMASDVVDFPGSPHELGPGPDMRGPSARYRIYDAADGPVFLAAPLAGEWGDLAEAMAPHIDLRADVRFATETDRQRNDSVLGEVLAGVFVTRGKDDWQKDLSVADVACVAVTTGPNEELLISDEYGRASGYLVDVTHPVFDAHPRLAPVVRFSRSATSARAGDLCGSATDRVLVELGYTSEQIADLRAKSVVG